ncbi:MAG: hypothetical protein ABIJ33_04135, partial [Patescibacteria group bacterium]
AAAARKRGLRGKGIAAAASALLGRLSAASLFFEIFLAPEIKREKRKDTLGPTHPSARVKIMLPLETRFSFLVILFQS